MFKSIEVSITFRVLAGSPAFFVTFIYLNYLSRSWKRLQIAYLAQRSEPSDVGEVLGCLRHLGADRCPTGAASKGQEPDMAIQLAVDAC